jgi:hypothetical protein
MGSIDFAQDRLVNLAHWQESAIDVLALTIPPILVGNVDGHAPQAWLANPHLLLPLLARRPGDTRIPMIVLAHKISARTKCLIAGTSLLGATATPWR